MFSAPGEVNCYCAPRELSITTWPWNSITSGHHIVKCRVPPGMSTCIVPQMKSVSPVGHDILSPVDWSLFNVQCPRGSQLLLCPRGTQYHQLPLKYCHQWTGHCLMFSAPGEVNCYCAPRELSITTWPWNSITSGHHVVNCRVPPGMSTCIVSQMKSVSPVGHDILSPVDWSLFNVQCPWGSPLYCALGELSITIWPWNSITSGHHIVKCGVPPGMSTCIVPQMKSVSPVGHDILSPVDWSLFNVQCPRGSQLLLCPRGTQYHQLPLKYCHQRTSCYLMLSVPEGVNCCCCAPGKLSITTWPWNSITSGHPII